jgi:tetratricopeptide (TPR) repeat protein
MQDLRKEYEAALKDFTEVIRLDPEPGNYERRGTAYLATKDCERAVEDFTAAIRLEPGEARHYEWRAEAYREKGDVAKAQADRQTAEQLRQREKPPKLFRG